ncbi:uncharacterized protein KD926_009005 [Aspergillus affinis]|uniref:uncharacterized protein n=1 Tax=Aspergillus affinis TaxID=1070780 RepID=UPI0022FF3942|nr:uncharacterized protein KD926_009005 [Aspergillus affinis]KAI9039904.1 hypothetical protein KD926_009005 [Aspergillus affinis]
MSYQREIYRFSAGPLGHIEGLTVTSDGTPVVRYFGGLPYALPPTAQWRFRAPRRLPPGYHYRTAAEPGQFTRGTWVCPQPPSSNMPDASVVDENCLQLNIWVPARPAPKDGWPVCFYIHGGFLQVGTANLVPEALVPLLSDSAFQAIMVLPSYRLNALGFLTSSELVAEARASGQAPGNMGLWDQRIALEWTHANISCFGGNPANITVAGYSAGAYSTFQQLAHELWRVPAENAIIRRVAMFSNSPGVRPKALQDHQEQFDEFLTRIGIPIDLDNDVKLAKLRALPCHRLIEIQSEMKVSEFRVLADDISYPKDLIDRINDGRFARRMKSRGVTLLNGECKDENIMYGRWRTPEDSYTAVYERLNAEYARRLVCVEETIPSEWGVTHLTDIPIWLWGSGFSRGLTDQEKEWLRGWNEGFAAFVNGDQVSWGPTRPNEVRKWRSDGKTDVWEDSLWEEGIAFWRIANPGRAGADFTK